MATDRYGIPVPSELQPIPPQRLEEYVKARLLQFVGEPLFAKRMYQTVEGVQRAARDVLTELAVPPGSSLQDGTTGTYSLQFRHECRSIGCLSPDCELCKQAQHRRCTSCFGAKYLSGDALKAKCGAPIIVEIINPLTGDVVGLDKVCDVQLEICVMDSRAYAALTPGMETPEELDNCTLLVNSQGKELLSPGKNANYNDEHKIITPMQNNTAELQVHVAGSSIAMLQGQRPPFRLLVRVSSTRDSRRLDFIKPAVSDAFVVATQRVKTAQKAEIPHIDEPVSKIENVGVQTQNKLQDIKAAAEQIGVHGLSVVHNCITTVGQFKELVESSETDQPLQETLKKVLNFTSNGWHKAREHAMRAVSTDNRMRAWCADDSLEDGLLFKCYLGRVDLEAPVGILRRTSIEFGSGTVSFDVSLLSDLTSQQKATMSSLQEAARKAWWQPGHPGWCIPWDYDSTAFMRSLTETHNVAQPAPNPKMRISAPVPRNLQNAGVLQHLSNTLGMSMPHSLASSDTHLGGGYSSKGPHTDPLQQFSAAQLLPNFSSLYTSNPGAMLGSGQAAHQALGSQTHTSLAANLGASNLGASNAQTQRYLAGLGMGQGAGASLPDAEAYAAFGNPNDAGGGPRPLLRGGSLARGFALPMQGPGGFKVNQLPTSPFEGMRQHSGGAASTSSGAGPFAQPRGIVKTQSMDTTSNSAGQLDRPPVSRALGSSASQKQQEPSPRSRESPFEAYKQQQQMQQQRGDQDRDRDRERERHFHQGHASQQPSAQSHQPSLGAWPNPQAEAQHPHGRISSPHQPPPSGPQPPRQPSGLSNFQQHQIQQVYTNLMHRGQKQTDDVSVPPRHQASAQGPDPQYPLQPVPSRLGPNSVLSLPPYRMPPALTTNDLDTIVKLRQQLSGENGLLTRLSSFMQAQRSTDPRQIAGHDSSESLREDDKSSPGMAGIGSGLSSAGGPEQPHPSQEQPHPTRGGWDGPPMPEARPAKHARTEHQEGAQQEAKPILSRFSSKVEGLLDELTDVLGAFEHIAPAEGETPVPNRFSGQEINKNGLNGVHKSAFEPVTSTQNKRRKLAAHNSSESDNNSQPQAHEHVAEHDEGV